MLMQISSGQGPAECELAAGLLWQALNSEYQGLVLEKSHPGSKKGGFSSLMFRTEQDLRHLEGSVLWICQSPYRPQHKRKNWYVFISIIEETPKIEDDGNLRIDTFRSGGKGGQHVNKVETGVRVTHVATGLSVSSTSARSQHMNKQLAMNRLCEMLAQLETNNQEKEKTLAWAEHSRIIRGNPVRTYKGRDFKLKR